MNIFETAICIYRKDAVLIPLETEAFPTLILLTRISLTCVMIFTGVFSAGMQSPCSTIGWSNSVLLIVAIRQASYKSIFKHAFDKAVEARRAALLTSHYFSVGDALILLPIRLAYTTKTICTVSFQVKRSVIDNGLLASEARLHKYFLAIDQPAVTTTILHLAFLIRSIRKNARQSEIKLCLEAVNHINQIFWRRVSNLMNNFCCRLDWTIVTLV